MKALLKRDPFTRPQRDAMEFLLDKMKRTRSNREFLDSMNT